MDQTILITGFGTVFSILLSVIGFSLKRILKKVDKIEEIEKDIADIDLRLNRDFATKEMVSKENGLIREEIHAKLNQILAEVSIFHKRNQEFSEKYGQPLDVLARFVTDGALDILKKGKG